MYRKTRFLEELIAVREEMSRECDYDIDLFAEMIRSGRKPPQRDSAAAGSNPRPRREENDAARRAETRDTTDD